jgi:hypothetical protein
MNNFKTMGSKKNKTLKDFINALGDQVISKNKLGKLYGGTKHQTSQGNQGCSGIVPQ